VSKIVNWGHWVVTLLACVWFVDSFTSVVHSTASMGHAEPSGLRILGVNFVFVIQVVVSALFAWGIFRWRTWGYLLALAICTFELLAGAAAVIAGDFSLSPLILLAPLLIVVWLLIPGVRAAYWRRATVQSQDNS
jgi:hypothetical protein